MKLRSGQRSVTARSVRAVAAVSLIIGLGALLPMSAAHADGASAQDLSATGVCDARNADGSYDVVHLIGDYVDVAADTDYVVRLTSGVGLPAASSQFDVTSGSDGVIGIDSDASFSPSLHPFAVGTYVADLLTPDGSPVVLGASFQLQGDDCPARGRPVITPDPVQPGDSIVAHGSGCTKPGGLNTGVEVAVLDAAHNVIAVGSIGADEISPNGEWSVPVEIPAGTPAGKYTLASTCDQYLYAFDYPGAPITITDVPAPAASGGTPKIHLGGDSVAAGGAISISGSGFAAGESVRVELHSTPVVLGTLKASANGTVSGTVRVPAATVPGAHHIALVGVTSHRTASAPLQVLAPRETPAALAVSGSRDTRLLVVAFALIAGGTLFVVGARRTVPVSRRT